MAKSKDIFKRGFKTLAERLGEDYRFQLGMSKFAPLDAFKLAEFLKVEIYSVYDVLEYNDAIKIVGTKSQPKDWSALWMANFEGDKTIIHNTNHSPSRQQSNVMHELSHIIRNHETPADIKRLCMQLGLRSYNKLQEEEAKFLGGCLQITRPGLMWATKEGMSKEQIAEYYNASIEMVNFRINATGVFIQRSRMN